MAECPKCDGEGWLWRHELPNPCYDPCESTSDDTRYICPYCDGTGDAAAEIERLRAEIDKLRAENEALRDMLGRWVGLRNYRALAEIRRQSKSLLGMVDG